MYPSATLRYFWTESSSSSFRRVSSASCSSGMFGGSGVSWSGSDAPVLNSFPEAPVLESVPGAIVGCGAAVGVTWGPVRGHRKSDPVPCQRRALIREHRNENFLNRTPEALTTLTHDRTISRASMPPRIGVTDSFTAFLCATRELSPSRGLRPDS